MDCRKQPTSIAVNGARPETCGPLLRSRSLLILAAVLLLLPATGIAADYSAAEQHFRSGQYAKCLNVTAAAVNERLYGERWPALKARVEATLGRYQTARDTLQAGLQRYTTSVTLRLQLADILRLRGESKAARDTLAEIADLAARSPWRYTNGPDLVAIGQAALRSGADARTVLFDFFDRARREHAYDVSAWQAIGELALAKHDPELAAEEFRKALKQFPEEPDLHFGLAKALADSDRDAAGKLIEKTLALNPQHVAALLWQAEQHIDSERYSIAEKTLQSVLAINPHEPTAWAFRAVLAHLENDSRGEALARAAAQGIWQRNPEVEHNIGRLLSRKYRFREGAEFQRRALKFDPNFLPARMQLTQDLLRLGEEHEGWQLAQTVHDADAYDVAAFNLLALRDEIAKFRTLKSERFIVRMDAREAEVYGDRVLSLLNTAADTLCAKYELNLTDPITVEIFPDADDFAVRTFGMPAVSGYLGVCFGRVITANSPASQAEHPSNWEAVLWHEFCHVVTLEITKNKMPRWLSEGISVHEELQRNTAWGQRMNPTYRTMILNGELTPIHRLSDAFLNAKSGLHVQFAYYQSALVVEYLVDRFGHDALLAILRDLGAGLPINVALDRQTDGLLKLETDFAAFALKRASEYAPAADWTTPDLAALLNDDDEQALAKWIEAHPTNIAALSTQADQLVENRDWAAAVAVLQTIRRLHPEGTGGLSAWQRLATAYRHLDQTDNELATLAELVRRDGSELTANLRLLELATARKDWIAAATATTRLLAINPLLPRVQRTRAVIAEHQRDSVTAIAAYRALLALQPDDPADVHYRLARMLHQAGDAGKARRHVLESLQEAPRFREAHRLLLVLHREQRTE